MRTVLVATVEDLERALTTLPPAPDDGYGYIGQPGRNLAEAITEQLAETSGAFAHPDSEARAYLAVERSAVIAAARRFLEAHDRVAGSDKAVGVTRDDTFAMWNRAQELRDVLQLHDENLAGIVRIRREVGAELDPATDFDR